MGFSVPWVNKAGLRDEDLLRPLRQFGVLDPAQRETRPIFALVERSKNREKDLVDHGVLLERYGLHVIPYDQGTSDKTQNLKAALVKLREDLQHVRRKWSEKPLLKRPEKSPKLSKPYYEIKPAADIPVRPLKRLEEEICHPGIVVLEGPSGSGKSLHLLNLIEQQPEFRGIFYWNAHYGNEAMTALDQALAYFDPRREIAGSRHQRICQCLRDHRFLLILDGCERLLRRTGNPGEGITYSVTFRRLLKAFANPANLSTVVLATRLWPTDLDLLQHKGEDRPFIRRLVVPRVEAEDLHGLPAFADLLKLRPQVEGKDSEWKRRVKLEISALCSLLRGHSHGLHLAGKYLQRRRDPPENSQQASEESAEPEVLSKLLGEEDLKALRGLKDLMDLNRRLAEKHRDERLQEMVQLQILRVDAALRADEDQKKDQSDKPADENRSAEPARDLLYMLTNFLGPICTSLDSHVS